MRTYTLYHGLVASIEGASASMTLVLGIKRPTSLESFT